jgi:thiol:disulfide interchange protein DsbC
MVRIILCICLLLLSSSPGAGAASEPSWLKGVPLEGAVKIGNGSRIVVEVSDPDCRFSRRMADYWNLRKDVTRYVFLVAAKNHPDAPQKARFILCSPDRAAAYQKVFSGGIDFDEKALDRHYDDHGLLDLHRDVAARLGAKGTPTYFIEGTKVDGAKVEVVDRLLGGKKFPFALGELDE